jgi:aryl-alcohol dehydrogenase-like predicted oxidoreductase
VELRRLGTSGLRVSALSLGAMTFGASQTLMKGVTSSDEEARRVFDRALEAGSTSLIPPTSTMKGAAKN